MQDHCIRLCTRLLVALVACGVITSCGEKPAPTPAQQKSPSAIGAIAKIGQLATDPIAQMSLTFQDNPPQEEIREKLDGVLKLYGLEVNNENRSQAGRTLVALRKEHGHSEMQILDKMLTSPTDGTKFDEAAARISAGMNQ